MRGLPPKTEHAESSTDGDKGEQIPKKEVSRSSYEKKKFVERISKAATEEPQSPARF